MPRGNGTGPMGLGPMTGRGAGYCAGYGVPGYMNPVGGCGGLGLGRGKGVGRSFANTARAQSVQLEASTDQQLTLLEQQLARLEQASTEIRKRIASMNSANAGQKQG